MPPSNLCPKKWCRFSNNVLFCEFLLMGGLFWRCYFDWQQTQRDRTLLGQTQLALAQRQMHLAHGQIELARKQMESTKTRIEPPKTQTKPPMTQMELAQAQLELAEAQTEYAKQQMPRGDVIQLSDKPFLLHMFREGYSVLAGSHRNHDPKARSKLDRSFVFRLPGGESSVFALEVSVWSSTCDES